ncbi:hypothetical protein LTR56_003002 [Elasticomyces elasticus]|nr:hypothetical protein LTR56_003002 [Elasticomyces elasticus]KAK3662065.1 hypothetical protein LTR22_007037 [Elasticomyces elasticus]KAK4927573.1 hypothetical protein LTR49_005714 [Elasticomyces elasticus]KAK5753214.1 hypothetical protein LTS12_016681 [Elasticomyces elasticus]
MVRFYATTTLLALLATFTAASPITKRSKPKITPNTQSCGAVQHSELLRYTLYIGVTYANGNGCRYIDDQLKALLQGPKGDQSGNYGGLSCQDDGNGDTLLKFSTGWDQGWAINDLMHRIYPMVNGFNCPSK